MNELQLIIYCTGTSSSSLLFHFHVFYLNLPLLRLPLQGASNRLRRCITASQLCSAAHLYDPLVSSQERQSGLAYINR